MSAVVQATCPGCKKTLRIPAEWARQAIRCKHCGAVLNAKSSAKPKPAPAQAAAPPPVRRAVTTGPTRPPAPGVSADVTATPFAELDDDAGPPPRRRNHHGGA